MVFTLDLEDFDGTAFKLTFARTQNGSWRMRVLEGDTPSAREICSGVISQKEANDLAQTITG